jgi:hypothetical protein
MCWQDWMPPYGPVGPGAFLSPSAAARANACLAGTRGERFRVRLPLGAHRLMVDVFGGAARSWKPYVDWLVWRLTETYAALYSPPAHDMRATILLVPGGKRLPSRAGEVIGGC